MFDVVFNSKYGGYSLSRACVKHLADSGNVSAIVALDSKDTRTSFRLLSVPRHDKALVHAVKQLGPEVASGPNAWLEIAVISGPKYRITEYDGLERVMEPDQLKWVEIEEV